MNDALGHAGPVGRGRRPAAAGGRPGARGAAPPGPGRRLRARVGGRRQGELSALVRAGDRVLRTTARRNAELEETIRILPTTLRELRPTLEELEGFARRGGAGGPRAAARRPRARPGARGCQLARARPARPVPRRGRRDRRVPSARCRPPRARSTRRGRSSRSCAPALRDLLPVVDYLGLFPNEAVTFFAGRRRGVQLHGPGRTTTRCGTSSASIIPFSPEGLVGASERFGTNRHNPYIKPRWLDDLPTGLESIDCRHTGNISPAGHRGAALQGADADPVPRPQRRVHPDQEGPHDAPRLADRAARPARLVRGHRPLRPADGGPRLLAARVPLLRRGAAPGRDPDPRLGRRDPRDVLHPRPDLRDRGRLPLARLRRLLADRRLRGLVRPARGHPLRVRLHDGREGGHRPGGGDRRDADLRRDRRPRGDGHQLDASSSAPPACSPPGSCCRSCTWPASASASSAPTWRWWSRSARSPPASSSSSSGSSRTRRTSSTRRSRAW